MSETGGNRWMNNMRRQLEELSARPIEERLASAEALFEATAEHEQELAYEVERYRALASRLAAALMPFIEEAAVVDRDNEYTTLAISNLDMLDAIARAAEARAAGVMEETR